MRSLWLVLGILLTSAQGISDEVPQDSIPLDDYSMRAHHLFVTKDFGPNDSDFRIEHRDELLLVLSDRLQTKEHRYLAASASSVPILFFSDKQDLKSLCEQYPPREDDYVFRNNCLYSQAMDPNASIAAIQDLGEQAYKAHPNRQDGSLIYSLLATYLYDLNRLNEGIRATKRQFEMTPSHAKGQIASIKFNLALAYANPVLSPRLHELAIQYYEEGIAWYESQKGTRFKLQELAGHYNLGIAWLFLFQNHKAAIVHLQKALPGDWYEQDARIFLAFSYVESGQHAAAREMLGTVDLTKIKEANRVLFLSCYRDLTRFLLGDPVSIKSCWQLESPPADVLMHLTKVLSRLRLQPEDENIWWRMFYHGFEKNILPDLQNSMEAASSEVELIKERMESRLKDLKLQNLNLYEYLIGTLAGLASLLGIAGFLAWKARASAQQHAVYVSAERARLQNILDSIDEGIFLIHPDLQMVAEESQHLQNILGPHYRSHMDLDEFLALSDLSVDIQSVQIACLKASMGEEDLVWQLNHGNLVTEVCLGGKFLNLFWKPVFQDGHLQAMFLALRDVTDEYLLKQANVKSQEDADRVLVFVKQISRGNIQATIRFLATLPARLEEIEERIGQQNFEACLLSLHSVKGTARSLGLADLSDIAHRLEDQLQKRDRPAVLEVFAEVSTIARLYLSAQHFYAEDLPLAALDLFQIVADLRRGVEQHLHAADIRLHKLQVLEMGHLTPAEYEKVRDILLHGFTNACDHGFILPSQAGKLIRAPAFTVEIHSDAKCRTLLLRDNGVGIAHAELKALAEARHWRPEPGSSWTDILFAEGISTAASVSLSSGRGVGLAAIREAVQLMDGKVRLRDNEHETGTVLDVTWPAPSFADAGTDPSVPKAS